MSYALFVSALTADAAAAQARADALGLSPSETWNVLVVVRLRQILRELARSRGCDPAVLEGGRLFRSVPGFVADARAREREALVAFIEPALSSELPSATELSAEAFGQLYESLLAARPENDKRTLRKRTGSYYTPEALTRLLCERAFDAFEGLRGPSEIPARQLTILDPALGAAAFLVQAGRQIARRSGRPLAEVVRHELFGVDVSPLAVAAAEASLWLLADAPELRLEQAGAHLGEGDALCTPAAGRALGVRGVDFPALGATGARFDLVIGNPPWVAFAGRATQPLPPSVRAHYRRTFRAFRGYPTLHALFLELAAGLAPEGVVGLLIPSPVADLEGYRHVRAALASTHAVVEPLLELGQDAFESVTQPCFALVAVPRTLPSLAPERPFVLSERSRAASSASELATPSALERMGGLPRFPRELFGEMGLQTNGAVSRQLLFRGTPPPPGFSYALLEGRNVVEFQQTSPRLFLKPDRALLAEHGCRLRDVSDYARVKLVIRQTAAITIASAHGGTPFRNSLLAGFELPEFPYALTLGLLNSTLYRALHLAARRDARQGVFPQVKVAHLRSLPAPPRSSLIDVVAELALRAGREGLTHELRRELDGAVFGLFGLSRAEGEEVARFVSSRSPRAGLTAPLG